MPSTWDKVFEVVAGKLNPLKADEVAPVARINRLQRQRSLKVVREDNQTYEIQELSNNPSIIMKLLKGKGEFMKISEQAKYFMIIGCDI